MTGQQILWTAARAAEATGGTNTADWAATGLSINTRTLVPGDLFIALTGPNRDGHDFVKAAFDKGASAAIVHRPIADLPTGQPLLQVADSFVALQDMAVAARADSQARFVGITGSVGKTTVKNALAHCLSAQTPTSASQASFNNHWGVPFSLCTHQPDAVYALNELGMSAAGEIRALSALVRPDIAIITTIAPAHMAAFQSLAEVAAAKSEIFDSMAPDGIAILNRDHALFAQMDAAARSCGLKDIRSFGWHKAASCRILDAELHTDYSLVSLKISEKNISIRLAAPGQHQVMNAAAVLCAVDALGADLERAGATLATLPTLPGRGQSHQITLPDGAGQIKLIDDSYNANPESVRALLALLGADTPRAQGRRIVVLGDMLELGQDSARFHSELSVPLRDNAIARVYACGHYIKTLAGELHDHLPFIHADHASELATRLIADLRDGDIVAVKGSRSRHMDRVVTALLSLSTNLSEANNKGKTDAL